MMAVAVASFYYKNKQIILWWRKPYSWDKKNCSSPLHFIGDDKDATIEHLTSTVLFKTRTNASWDNTMDSYRVVSE